MYVRLCFVNRRFKYVEKLAPNRSNRLECISSRCVFPVELMINQVDEGILCLRFNEIRIERYRFTHHDDERRPAVFILIIDKIIPYVERRDKIPIHSRLYIIYIFFPRPGEKVSTDTRVNVLHLNPGSFIGNVIIKTTTSRDGRRRLSRSFSSSDDFKHYHMKYCPNSVRSKPAIRARVKGSHESLCQRGNGNAVEGCVFPLVLLNRILFI